jgi:APA family basic amino acid/polyamine antiporter
MQQKIGLWPLTSLVTGNLVGSAVFLLPATLAAYGSVSLLGWILTSLGAILLALIFSDLAAHSKARNGGPHIFAQQAFGKDVGFFTCWGYWALSWVGNAALIVGAVSYMEVLYGDFSSTTALVLELVVLFSVMMFNLLSISITGRGELIITLLKVIPLLVLPIVGLWHINIDHFFPINPSSESLGSAINSVGFLTLWAYIGIETGTVPAGQVTNAKKTVPLAIIYGTLIAAAVYILGTVAIMGVVPHEQLLVSKAPYADAASAIFGGTWGVFVAVIAIISCIGTLNGWTLVVGRIPQSAAEDNLFPKMFARTNRVGTPYVGIMISSMLSIPFVLMSLEENLTSQFNTIIDIAVSSILMVYFVCILSYFKILSHDKALTPKKLVIGVLAALFTLWTLWATSLKMLSLSLIIFLLGVPVYVYMRLRK